MSAPAPRRRATPGRTPALALTALLVGLLVAAPAPVAPAVAAPDGGDPAWSQTRTLARVHTEADGSPSTVDERTVTVSVDRTENLRGRERVRVRWSGARPSAARTVSPYGADGMNQEYPVVVLQCRGVDDPAAPADRRLSPETCWTTTYLERYAAVSPALAVWRHDRAATDADRADQDAVADWPQECLRFPADLFSQRLLPFRSAKGQVYASCNDATVPPESAVDAALPASELAGFTGLDGTGDVRFEVRSSTENESLGCSSEVACSLVVIPIMGISCADADAACRGTGSFPPGSSNFGNVGVDPAVSPLYWWSASNWQHRFTVPLTFALPPDACDVLDPRAPVDMYGSELLSQATLQWAPAYCLRQDRFKMRHNRQTEEASLRLVARGEAAAAFVSDPAHDPPVPLGYAPVAVTGFAVAYVADLPDNAGEADRMRLTPRLLAKLLTQSYPASISGRAHPGLERNPVSLNADPEFVELNPGMSLTTEEARATVLSLSEQADTIHALTAYLAADPEAAAFVAGTPDPWGMVVNPSYRGVTLPVAEWPMLDTFVRDINRECESLNKVPYLGQVAAPVTTMRAIAEAVLDAWPNVQTQCTRATPTDPWKFGRIPRQGYGARFMLGLVTLGDAERYGLRTAELRTAGTGASATFVAAAPGSMAAALAAARQAGPGEPFLLDRSALSPDAYPGTMVVHTAARLSGMPPADARHVSQFVRVALEEGQVPGPGNGQLPAGYVPLVASGPTAPLHAAALAVADAVEAQRGAPAPQVPAPGGLVPPSGPGLPGESSAVLTSAPLGVGGLPPEAAVPATEQGLPADTAPAAAAPDADGTTVAGRSTTAGRLVPAMLGLSIAGMLGVPALRSFAGRRSTP